MAVPLPESPAYNVLFFVGHVLGEVSPDEFVLILCVCYSTAAVICGTVVFMYKYGNFLFIIC